jgi:hypothetical protein
MTDTSVDAGKTATAIQGESATDVPKLRLRQATVSAVTMQPLEGYDTVQTTGYLVDLILAGDEEAILPEVMTLSNYIPHVGDACWCLVNDTDIVAVDRVSGGPSLFSNTARVFTEGSGTIQQGRGEPDLSPDALDFTTTAGGLGTTAMISESGVWMMGFSAVLAPNWADFTGATESIAAMSVTTVKQSAAEVGGIDYVIPAESLVSWMIQGPDGAQFMASYIFLGAGLDPGQHAFTPQFASTPGVSAMKWRELWVIPL